MDRVLKVLIAAACVVVIGAGAAYVWQGITNRNAVANAERKESCERDLANLEKYEAGQTPANAESEAVTKLSVSGCRADGVLP